MTMDKQEFEWKARELGDKAKDLFQDEDDACYILSTGFKYDKENFAGCIECSGSDKNITVSVVRLICTMADKLSEGKDTTPRVVLNALFMTALKMLMDDDE